MGALRSVFGWIGSKLTRQGATNMAVRTAAAQAQKLPPKALQAISPPADGEEYMARGYRIMGFKRELVLGIALGVAVSFIIPGSGLIVQGLTAGFATNVVAAGVGVMAGEPAEPKAAAPDGGKGAEVTGMVPGDGGSTVQRQNSDPSEGQPSAPNTGPLVGGTTTGTTPHEGTSTTTTTTTTTEESTSTHEEPHEPPPPAHEDPHDDFDD